MSIVSAITDVFAAIGDWIAEQLGQLLPIFYNPTDGLTFLGVLAVMSLGFSVVFLIIGIIQRFLHFRG